jgi:uncharacterized protein (TIGR02466 family)
MSDYTFYNIFPTLILKNNIKEKIGEQLLNGFKQYALNAYQNINNKCTKNKNILNDNQFLDLKNEIEKSLNFYIKDVLKYNVEIYITQSWLNFANKGDSHFSHNHANSFLSGVLYIQANDHITFEQEKKFILRITPESYNENNSELVDVDSKTGDLIIFPSWLHHNVKENLTDELRISLAFNTFIKGTVGNYDNANELNI